MTTQFTHRSRLVAGSVLVVVAVTVLGGLFWGTWRLLSWGAVTATHHPYSYAAGGHRETMSPMGGYALGVDVVVTRGDVLVSGISVFAVLVALVAVLLALLFAMVRVGDYADDPGTAPKRASVLGAIGDGEFVPQRGSLTGEGSTDDPHKRPHG